MIDPVPVDDLRTRNTPGLELQISPGTNEETALRFLVVNPEYGWPPQEIAERTDINQNSVTKTMQRLREKGLVECVAGRYFVDPDTVDEIAGLLADLHGREQLEVGPDEGGAVPDVVDELEETHDTDDRTG